MVVKMAKQRVLEMLLMAVVKISYSNFEETSGLEEISELDETSGPGGTFEFEETFELEATSGLEETCDFAVTESPFAILGFVLSQNLGTLSSQE